MFTVTPAALAEVARRLEGKEEPVGIRIFVQGIG